MPEFEPVSPPHISAIKRPGCPKCRQQRMLLAKLGSGSPGFVIATFECQRCGYVSTTAIGDPLMSEVRGWLGSELRRPT